MTGTPKNPLTAATNKFLREAKPWLTPEDAPMVTGLKMLAAQLDREFQAALFTQYGVTYRTLLKKKPESAGEKDPLEGLLE